MVLLRVKLYFSKHPEGVPHFPGGGGGGGDPTFSSGGGGGGEGVQMRISIETHITCDFPGGGLYLLSPPLDPRMFCIILFARGDVAILQPGITSGESMNFNICF